MTRAAVLVLLLSTLSACAVPPIDPVRVVEVDRIAEKYLGRSGAPGFTVGIIDGKRTSVFGYGRVSKDSEAKPTGATVYEIGSITKVFTTFLLADLAQEGQVRLNDPIRLHLPSDVRAPRSADQEILLSHLATHTSGLPRLPANLPPNDDPYANYSANRLYDYLSAHRLGWPVGKRFEYSNLGMGLLGHLLERASGMTYEELVIKRLANPLKMMDTRIALTPAMKERLAPPYDAGGNPSRNWHFQALAGAGALRSTADDLLKFAAANLGQSDPRIAAVFATCQATRESDREGLRIGLGWHSSPVRAGGNWMVWHNGGTGGYSSFIGLVKETGTAVVILSNGSPPLPGRPNPIDQLGYELIELLNP